VRGKGQLSDLIARCRTFAQDDSIFIEQLQIFIVYDPYEVNVKKVFVS
jgi:hypothetical protein